MKKIFTLIFAFVACTFFAKAQITDNFESYTAFTVDPAGIWTYYDGDGAETHHYSSVTVSNLPYTGSCIVMNPSMTDPDITTTQGAHSGSQYLAIFNANPENLATGATTNDWVISPQMAFTNGGTLTLWARELTEQYGAETMRILYSTTDNSPSSFILIQEESVSTTTWTQYSYAIPAGAKYVAINCTSDDIFALFIDDIDLQIITSDPTIVAIPNAIDFGTVMLPGTETATVTVTGYNLTGNINANTSAPFSISADGTNFSTNISLPSTGGTLYVKYAPTNENPVNGTLTLFSGTSIATVSLTGSALDCGSARQLPYSCTFAANDPDLNCWESIDQNGDADSDHHGEFFFNGSFSSTNDGVAEYFYNASNAANDWMVSPLIALGYHSRASFDYLVASADYPETFSVYIIPEGATYTSSIQVLASQTVTNTDWATQNIDLSAYDYQTIRLAFRVNSAADMWYIAFDNLLVEGDTPPTLTSDVNSIVFGRTRVGSTREEVAVLTSTHLNEPINVVTTAPFSVSLDGLNFFTNLVIPANPAINVDDTLYVLFAPEAAGAYSENITATTSTLSVSITLKGSAFSCDTITEVPFTEDFDVASTTRDCWDFNDDNGDGSTFVFEGNAAQYTGDAANVANDWLLSPQIALTGNQLLTFEYRTPSTATGKFTVYAISSDTTILISGLIETTSSAAATQTFDLRNLNGIYRIGFYCTSDPGTASVEIDNFTVLEAEPSITADPSVMSFNIVIDFLGEINNDITAIVTGWALTEDISISATAPFEISLTGTNFGTEATLPVTGLETTAELYVRYSPLAEGTHSGMVILTSGNAADTIILNGTATSQAIAVSPEEMTFNLFIDDVEEPLVAQTAQVIGIDLTEDISVSTTVPFEISTNNQTYGTSATIPVMGDETIATLYVRYNPSSAGTHSGVVNLVSGMATATITLNGTAEIVGIEENTNGSIAIYPNPASTLLNVEAEGYDALQIVNLVGQVVYSAGINGRTQINVSDLSNGVYFVRLTNAEGTTTQKFVKR